jgi:hypothetical protein
MAKKTHKPEEIVSKQRQIDVPHRQQDGPGRVGDPLTGRRSTDSIRARSEEDAASRGTDKFCCNDGYEYANSRSRQFAGQIDRRGGGCRAKLDGLVCPYKPCFQRR